MEQNLCCFGVIIEIVVCYPCVWYILYHPVLSCTILTTFLSSNVNRLALIQITSVHYRPGHHGIWAHLNHEHNCLEQVIADA